MTELPALPDSLVDLKCGTTGLARLPDRLPDKLERLCCSGNRLCSLPSLPAGLRVLECSGCWLAELPALPDTLEELVCCENVLTRLPALPAGLRKLWFYGNKVEPFDLPRRLDSVRLPTYTLDIRLPLYWQLNMEFTNEKTAEALVRWMPDACVNELTKRPPIPRTARHVLRALLHAHPQALTRWHELASILHVLEPADRDAALAATDGAESFHAL